MADKAYLTSEILKWARTSAGISVEDAARKINVAPERLVSWENGTDYPTIRQAKILAKNYRRPFSILFLPEIPTDFQPLTDYRRADSNRLDTASIFMIREIREKQHWISELFEENGEHKLNFVGRFSLNDPPRKVAQNILKTLNINPGNYTKTPINEWIDKAEMAGVFISRTSYIHSKLTLDKDIIQGFAIADDYAPFIFINSKDWKAPQLFTLVHELAHIWIAKSGISNEIDIDFNNKPRSKRHPVELFCNEVAANALIPEELINQYDDEVFKSAQNIFKKSNTLGVSYFALLVRALNLNIITEGEYRSLRDEAQKDFELYLEKEKIKKKKEQKGGPNPYLIRLNKNSKLFTRIVMDTFSLGNISPSIASSLLNTPINNFQKFEKLLA